MTLDIEQTRFVDAVVNGTGHVVLTGRAGTGKSVSLIAAVNAAQAAQMDVLVMAPTAMAASIHRDAGLESGTIHHGLKWNPVKEPLARKLLAVCGSLTDWASAPDQARLLVIDEASMVGLWLFEILARDLGGGTRPLDGRRLVLVGDWAQLPPVVTEDDICGMVKELSRFGPPAGCILYHPLFSRFAPVAIELTKTHRADSAWFDTLDRVRECNHRASLDMLRVYPEAYDADTHTKAVHLCLRRSAAHARNVACLNSLPGHPLWVPLRDGNMVLKAGCDVIVTSNRAGGGFFNGSRAVFQGINQDNLPVLNDGMAIKMLADGNWGRSFYGTGCVRNAQAIKEGQHRATVLLRKYGGMLGKDEKDWLCSVSLGADERLCAAFGSGRVTFQPYFPLLPAYALTVHKAQGMTLGAVVLEDDIFWNIAPARLPYVALSRVRDASNTALAGCVTNAAYVKPDPAYAGITARISSWISRT